MPENESPNVAERLAVSKAQRCTRCQMPRIGAAFGPTGARIEALGYCSNCLWAYDGSNKLDSAWVWRNLK